MHVQDPQGRYIEHRLPQDLSVGGDHANVWPRARICSTFSGLLIDFGWKTGMPCVSASTFTGGGVSLRPRPVGLSGCVNTPTTSCSLSISRCSDGSENSGDPMKAMRIDGA